MITINKSQTMNGCGTFAFHTSETGQKYIIPAWIPVPSSTDFKDVTVVGLVPQPTVKVTEDRDWKVEGSTGTYYNVSRSSGHYTCDCPASMFRRHQECKHIKQIKEKENC